MESNSFGCHVHARFTLGIPHRLGRALHRAKNAHVRAAAAQIRHHVPANVIVGRRRIRFEQSLRAHDHARDAITALRGLLIDERLLQRTRIVGRAQSFDCRNLASGKRRDRRNARERRLAVDHHRASAALAEPATEFGAVHREMIAKHIEEGRRGIGIHRLGPAVDVELDHRLLRIA